MIVLCDTLAIAHPLLIDNNSFNSLTFPYACIPYAKYFMPYLPVRGLGGAVRWMWGGVGVFC